MIRPDRTISERQLTRKTSRLVVGRIVQSFAQSSLKAGSSEYSYVSRIVIALLSEVRWMLYAAHLRGLYQTKGSAAYPDPVK